ncbi:MAG: arginine--tRNA ligase [Caldisericia bacterium]|nr:arginine--tRNA ligase [Caldisericia bacterium]
MLVRKNIAGELYRIITEKGWDLPLNKIQVEQPPRIEMGDFATTISLVLARKLKRKPLDIAEEISKEIKLDYIDTVTPLPNGYINFFFTKDFLSDSFSELLKNSKDFLSNHSGIGKKALVEFVSANPTGPLTVANGRSAPIGDTIANLLELQGYTCDREFFINNMGSKAQKIAASVFYFYELQYDLNPETPEEMYPGDYIPELAKKLKDKFNNSLILEEKAKAIEETKTFCLHEMIKEMKQDLENFHVHFDNWFEESSLHDGYLEETYNILTEKNLTLEEDGAKWLRTTTFGDKKNRVLIRSNGIPTYLMGDIAYHRNKLERGYDLCVDVWGADQSHVKPLMWALNALGFKSSQLKTVTFQLVHLFKDGKEVKMSKSDGNYITLRNLLESVGTDVSRFVYLSRSNEQHLNFDLDITKNRDPKNPVFYAQYAYTRCQGIKREAESKKVSTPELISDIELSLLNQPSELQILRHFSLMPEFIDRACFALAPHMITQDIQLIATDFHTFYEKCRVVDENNIPLTKARLLLVKGIETMLKTLFNLIGINAPEKM